MKDIFLDPQIGETLNPKPLGKVTWFFLKDVFFWSFNLVSHRTWRVDPHRTLYHLHRPGADSSTADDLQLLEFVLRVRQVVATVS